MEARIEPNAERIAAVACVRAGQTAEARAASHAQRLAARWSEMSARQRRQNKLMAHVIGVSPKHRRFGDLFSPYTDASRLIEQGGSIEEAIAHFDAAMEKKGVPA